VVLKYDSHEGKKGGWLPSRGERMKRIEGEQGKGELSRGGWWLLCTTTIRNSLVSFLKKKERSSRDYRPSRQGERKNGVPPSPGTREEKEIKALDSKKSAPPRVQKAPKDHKPPLLSNSGKKIGEQRKLHPSRSGKFVLLEKERSLPRTPRRSTKKKKKKKKEGGKVSPRQCP